MIEFACPSCQKRYRVSPELAGRKAKCKQCGQPITVPIDTQAAAADEPREAVPDSAAAANSAAPTAAQPAPQPAATAAGTSSVSSASPASVPAASSKTEATSGTEPTSGHEVLQGTTDTLSYEISQRPDFAMVKIDLPDGHKVYSEPSAMVSMTPNVLLEAGFKGGLGKTLGRMLGGESLIINTYTAQNGPGEVMFAGGAAGDVAYYRLQNNSLFLQRGSFMLHGEGVEVSGSWQGAKGFFSGEGLVLLKATGAGDLFFNSYGAILEFDVTDEFFVDTGYVVAFEDTLQYKVTVLPGLRTGGKIKSFFFGGEGLVCQFSGQGRVWVQTRQVNSFLSWVNPYRPTRKN